MYEQTETIAAIATAPGKGGVGVIRISGATAHKIACALTTQTQFKPRFASLCHFFDAQSEPIDSGLVIYFKAPASFTGEDVIEVQGHGGPVVLSLLLERVLQLGARMANPGEFSLRAYLNNKIDLTQAESVAAIIDANSKQALKAAVRSLQGVFSTQVHRLQEQITQLRMLVEGAIDFPDEGIETLNHPSVTQPLAHVMQHTAELLAKTKRGVKLSQGTQVAILGKPNAGKSSLLNCLSQSQAAIVTDIPGTTRDVIQLEVEFSGVRFELIDTAGLRVANDVVEQEGIKRAWAAGEGADIVLLVVDAQDPLEHTQQNIQQWLAKLSAECQAVLVLNKIDLHSTEGLGLPHTTLPTVLTSAKNQEGIEELIKTLTTLANKGLGGEQQNGFSARTRHVTALEQVQQHLLQARHTAESGVGIEMMAEELRLAQQSLSELTGEFTPDDLLGEIFSEFCIGK